MPNVMIYVNDKTYAQYLILGLERKKTLRKRISKMISKEVAQNGDNSI